MNLLQAGPAVAYRRYNITASHADDHFCVASSSSPPSHLPNEEGFLLLHHFCVTVQLSYIVDAF